MRLMKLPIDNYNNVLTVLKLEHFAPLFEYFDYQARKTMSIYIVNNALDNETVISTPEQVRTVVRVCLFTVTIIVIIVMVQCFDVVLLHYSLPVADCTDSRSYHLCVA